MLLFQEWSDGGGRGECKKMEIGCSEVNVMVQECRYDEQEFFYDKERHTDTRSYVRCSIGVGSFTNNGSGVNDPNNPYLILARSRLKEKSYGEGVYISNEISCPNACGYLGRLIPQFMWRSPTRDSTMRGWKGMLNKIITTH